MRDNINWIIESHRKRARSTQVKKHTVIEPSTELVYQELISRENPVSDQDSHLDECAKKYHRSGSLKKLFSGAFIGFVEISVGHPLWVLKTRTQQKYPFRLHPKVLYKGFSVNFFNEVLIATSQVYISMSFEDALASQRVNGITGKIASGLIGGGMSTLITTPAELVMTIQHRDNVNPINVIKKIVNKYGVKQLFVGGVGTAFRESFFVAGYYSFVPLLKPVFVERFHTGELGSSLLSGVFSGATSAVLSQPWDTIKTEQQARADKKNQQFFRTMHRLYQSNGIKGFFSGTLARMTRSISATTIMGNLLDKINSIDEEDSADEIGMIIR